MKNDPRRAASEAMPKSHIAIHLETLPERYALEVAGGCMAPAADDGALVEVYRDEIPKAGELAVIYFRDPKLMEQYSDGILKRMVLGLPSEIQFPFTPHPDSTVSPVLVVEQANPPGQMVFRCEDILAVHRCIGTIDAARCVRRRA